MSKIISVTDDSFNSAVLNSTIPVMVNFSAPWVTQCSLFTPVLEELAESNDNKIKIAILNVDDNDITVQRYNIKAMPTLILFKNGRVTECIVGTRSKNQLDELISKYI